MKRIFAAMLVIGCGASPALSESPQALPPSGTNGASNGDPRSCDHLTPIAAPTTDPTAPPSTRAIAGQMSEQAARAKRLFDAERWSEAERALTSVVHGESGDDAGNMQLAQYHLAIAIYRQKDMRRSYAIFSEMARNPSHIKHTETLLWLAKFVIDHGELVDFADFATYTRDDAARFDNANQREVLSTASFAIGHARLQEGARAEALAFFARVDPEGPLGALAARCRDRAR